MNKQFVFFVLFHCFQLSDVLASNQVNQFSSACNQQNGNTHSRKGTFYNNEYRKYFLHQERVVLRTNYKDNQSNCSSYNHDCNASNSNNYNQRALVNYGHQDYQSSYSSYNQQRSNRQVQKNQENDDDQQGLAQGYQSSYSSYNQHCNASNSNNYNQQALVNYGHQDYQSSYLSYDQQRSNRQGSLDSRSVVNDKLSYSFFKCKTKDEIKNFIEQMSVEELDSPITNNFESIGHILLRRRDRENFKLWLDKGASCSTISGNQEKNPHFNNVSILHLLCIKGLDEFPDLLDLIKEVLRRNPSLLFFDRGKDRSSLSLIVYNENVNDDVTLEILKEFSKYLILLDCPSFNKIFLKPKTKNYLILQKFYLKNKKNELSVDKEDRKNFISNLPIKDLDNPFLDNKGCIGQFLLKNNDIESFQAWLDRGALCTSKADKDIHKASSQETVLSSLCIKGLDIVPNLVDLIIKVLDRNPSLLFHLQNDQVSVVSLILNNKNISDDVTLEILQIFTSRGFSFIADPIIYDKYCNSNYHNIENNKLKSINYIKYCIRKSLENMATINS